MVTFDRHYLVKATRAELFWAGAILDMDYLSWFIVSNLTLDDEKNRPVLEIYQISPPD